MPSSASREARTVEGLRALFDVVVVVVVVVVVAAVPEEESAEVFPSCAASSSSLDRFLQIEGSANCSRSWFGSSDKPRDCLCCKRAAGRWDAKASLRTTPSHVTKYLCHDMGLPHDALDHCTA